MGNSIPQLRVSNYRARTKKQYGESELRQRIQTKGSATLVTQ